MNTLLALNKQLLCIANKPTWDQTIYTLNSTTLNTFPQTKTSWKLHAQSKGFGGPTPNNNNNNKSMQKKENASKPSSNKQQEEIDDDDDKIPQVVFDRMVRRIVTSVGLPLAIGGVFLKLFDILQERHLFKVPLWIPFVTTFVFFGSSALGVVYGSLSTSWDAEKEGSILGLDEAKVNWVEMWKEEDDK